MANNVITIDVSKVNKAGKDIIDDATKMRKALTDITDIVNSTKKCLQSDGGDSARANFNSSAAEFDKFKKFINEYGEYLISYGKAHVDLDEEVSSLAKKIPKL